MIFLSVGTERFAFDRLIRGVDAAIREGKIKDEVFGQIGCAGYQPLNFRYKNYMKFEEVLDWIKRARLAVIHAGVGSVLTCLHNGKIPIVVPREKKYGEHLDDHQIEFAEKMAELGNVLTAPNMDELIRLIHSYDQRCAGFKRCVEKSFEEPSPIVDCLNRYLQRLPLSETRKTCA